MIIKAIAAFGRRWIDIFSAFGRAGYMLFRALLGKPEFRKQWPLLMKQLYAIGVQSLLIIAVSGLFIGVIGRDLEGRVKKEKGFRSIYKIVMRM